MYPPSPAAMRFRRALSHAATSLQRVQPGTVSPPRKVPDYIIKPPYALNMQTSSWNSSIPILNFTQQMGLRIACELAKEMCEFAGKQVHIGQTTDEIDRLVHEEIIRHRAYPSPLNYGGYPKSICTSVNEVVVHGIPDSRPLADGDIINIDVSVYIGGFHGDTSRMYEVGTVEESSEQLIRVTNEALKASIKKCAPCVRFSVIGDVVEDICEKNGFSVIEEYAGHGIGEEFHCYPYVMHNRNEEDTRMLPGMAFTIEPPICVGKTDVSGRRWASYDY
uniref:Methionine aminopeptidase n=1 Tax=Albugo laibachii Nc14 TaxID=890382 RepID=F0WE88_9STRA|nr:methionine aminopeptidase putative [Albugo laibachii Nc14]|eukprot:CCA19517.1 methionine aminopeptidase putative [Albugo laibachii Nc14]